MYVKPSTWHFHTKNTYLLLWFFSPFHLPPLCAQYLDLTWLLHLIDFTFISFTWVTRHKWFNLTACMPITLLLRSSRVPRFSVKPFPLFFIVHSMHQQVDHAQYVDGWWMWVMSKCLLVSSFSIRSYDMDIVSTWIVHRLVQINHSLEPFIVHMILSLITRWEAFPYFSIECNDMHNVSI